MLDYFTIREIKRLEKNANRMHRARRQVEMAIKTNEIADLDLEFVRRKLLKAEEEMRSIAARMTKH